MNKKKFGFAVTCVFLVILIVFLAANNAVSAAPKSGKTEKGKALEKEKQESATSPGKNSPTETLALAAASPAPGNSQKSNPNIPTVQSPTPAKTSPTGLVIQAGQTPTIAQESSSPAPEQTTSAQYYSNELLIKVKKDARNRVKGGNPVDTGIASIDNINREYGAKGFEKVAVAGKNSNTNAEVFSWYKVTLDGPREIIAAEQSNSPDGLLIAHSKAAPQAAGRLQQLIQRFNNDQNIEAAEPNYIIYALLTPNDPYYSSSGSWNQSYPDLWGIKKINPEPAWDQTTGSTSIVVAGVDTGVDRNHEDISANMWVNPNEIPSNNVDDDNNGYKDDYYGWDWVSNDNDPMDDHGHGTHTVGTIAAVGNNAIGVVGVNWQSKIMALKFLSSSGSGSTDNGIKALQYAADMGAKISSNSWGCSCLSQATFDAVKYEHEKGMVVVVAAGNSNADALDFSPAAADRAMTIAASDSNDAKASFSNFGEKIDVAAPGVDVLSLKASTSPMCTSSNTVGTKYCRVSGTSMATPHVAGLAALIWAKNPNLTNEEVRQIIRNGANDLGVPGKDKDFGYGRINAANSINLAGGTKPLSPIITSPESRTRLSGMVTVKGSVPGPNFASYKLEAGTGRAPTTWTTITTSTTQVINGTLATFDANSFKNGYYILRLTATDTSGKNYQFQIHDLWVHENFPEYQVYIPGGLSAKSVSYINTTNDTIKKITGFSFYTYPFGIAITPDDKYAYVSDIYSNATHLIDTVSNTLVKTIPIVEPPRNSTVLIHQSVTITPDGKYVYIPKTDVWLSANTYRYATNVSLIDTATNTYIMDIPIQGTTPVGTAATPDSKYVYVTGYRSNTTSVIDTSTNTVVKVIPVLGAPMEIVVTPDGKHAYLATISGVSMIDTSTNIVAISNIPNVGIGQYLAISPDGKYLYVVSNNGMRLVTIDTSTNTVVKSRAIDYAAYDIAVTPDGKYVYLPTQNDGRVTVINTTSYEVEDIFNLGQPNGEVAIKRSGILPPPPPSNNPPVSSFTANPTSGNAPLTVNFDGSASSDPDAGDSIAAYSWTFGDGSTGSGVTISHIYQNAGTYTSTLVVTDTHSATGTSSKTITVTSAPAGDTTPPTVKITSPPNGTIVTSRATVTADATDNVGVSRVEFYDGSALKANDTSAPYSFVWNVKSKNVPKGSHLIKAVAFDTSNNKAEDSIILCKEYCTSNIVSSSEEGGPTGITGAIVSFFDGIANLFTRR